MHVERGKKGITAHFGDVMIIVMRKAVGGLRERSLKGFRVKFLTDCHRGGLADCLQRHN